MSADLVLAVDSSTTACKAIAYDERGCAVAEARAPIDLLNPNPDAWQQDAEQWWQAFTGATREIVAALGGGERLAALCITNQRETFVLTDEASKPLHPALVWMDSRCTAEVDAAVAELGAQALHEISGKPPCTTPSIYKLLFLLRQQPALAVPTTRVLDVHGLLAWRLTGRCATSLASADPTGMVDMRARTWSAAILAHAGLAVSQLPELVEPGEKLGAVSSEAAASTGLPAGLPVVAGAGDGQCAGLGAGIIAPGRAYLNLGTAVVSGVLASDYLCDRRFRTLFGVQAGSYFLETDLQGGTFTITWFIERFLAKAWAGVAEDALTFETMRMALEERAAELAVGADGLMLLPYFNGVMNPYWDDAAAGAVVGWRGHHEPAHLYRAILEGVAFEQRLHTEGVEAAAGSISEMVLMGGGSKSDLWCQIVADVLQKPVVRAGSSEATALGAGILAAVYAGLHADIETACAAMTSTANAFHPGADAESYDALYQQVYQGLYPALAEPFKRLASLR